MEAPIPYSTTEVGAELGPFVAPVRAAAGERRGSRIETDGAFHSEPRHTRGPRELAAAGREAPVHEGAYPPAEGELPIRLLPAIAMDGGQGQSRRGERDPACACAQLRKRNREEDEAG